MLGGSNNASEAMEGCLVTEDTGRLEHMQLEAQTLASWIDSEVEVTLLSGKATGTLKATTPTAIILEDSKSGGTVYCPWTAVAKIEGHKPSTWRERALSGGFE